MFGGFKHFLYISNNHSVCTAESIMVFAIQDQNVRNKESAFRHLILNIERVISKLSHDLPCDWVKISTNNNADKLAYFAREFLARVSGGNS